MEVSSGIIISLFLTLGFSVWASAYGSQLGYRRLESWDFWSMYSGTLLGAFMMTVVLAFISILSNKIANHWEAYFLNGLAIFLGFAIIGFFPAYFLREPKNNWARLAIGFFGLPLLGNVILVVTGKVLGLFLA